MNDNRENIIDIESSESFINIEDTYNGGNQHWFDSAKDGFSLAVSAGCGTVAASNLIAYLAFANPERYSNLVSFTKGNISKEDYTKYMEIIYKYVHPLAMPFTGGKKPLGIFSARALAKGIERYAKDKGCHITTDKLANHSFNESVDFIKNNLKNNTPVGLLIWFNSNEKPYETHWMTIIGLIESSESRNVKVKVSTWGKIETLNLFSLYDSPNLLQNFSLVSIKK